MIGIYAIVNTVTGGHYVGQSVRIKRRLDDHVGLLRRGASKTPHLQASWDKHGESVFCFVILEIVTGDIEDLTRAENFWMDECRIRGLVLYNTSPGARSRLGVPMSEEHKRRQSAARKGVPQPEKRNISYSRTMRGRPKPAAWCALMKVRANGFKPGNIPWNKSKAKINDGR